MLAALVIRVFSFRQRFLMMNSQLCSFTHSQLCFKFVHQRKLFYSHSLGRERRAESRTFVFPKFCYSLLALFSNGPDCVYGIDHRIYDLLRLYLNGATMRASPTHVLKTGLPRKPLTSF